MRPFATGAIIPSRPATPAQPRAYLMAYNGRSAAGAANEQYIGLAGSVDNVHWAKLTPITPALSAGGSGYNSAFVHAPCILKFGPNDYRMWFDGFDGTHFQIGYATSADGVSWSQFPGNPIITLSSAGTWDSYWCYFPCVFYEPSDASRPFKMWYAGVNTTTPAPNTVEQIGYAYSTNGIDWTKSSSNPVMTVGAGGSWEAQGVIPGFVLKTGSTYNLVYQGLPHVTTPENDQIGVATFTNPEGTYTKSGSNPVLSYSTFQQALTSNLAAGSATVLVGNTAGISAGEPALLFDSTLAIQDVIVKSVDSSTQLTLTTTVSRGWTTANSASIRSYYYGGAINGRTIFTIGSNYVMYTVPFQQFSASQVSERSGAATTAVSNGLTSGWANDFTRGIVLPLGTWDGLGAENPSVIAE